jgi:hypothetical protein
MFKDKQIFYMIKKIYCYLILFAVLASCKDDQVGIANYTRKTDMSASSLRNYQLQAAFMYSIDGGSTFTAFPNLKNGQTYQAKLTYNSDPNDYTFPDDGSIEGVQVGCPYVIDWSASDPQPKSVDNATGIATFVAGGKNSVISTVTNIAFNADDAVGTYEVVQDDWEDYFPGDQLTVQKIDATHIQIMEYPGTAVNHKPLVITVAPSSCLATVASQDNGAYSSPTSNETFSVSDASTTALGGIPSFVHSCAGTIQLNLSFKVKTTNYNGNILILKKI